MTDMDALERNIRLELARDFGNRAREVYLAPDTQSSYKEAFTSALESALYHLTIGPGLSADIIEDIRDLHIPDLVESYIDFLQLRNNDDDWMHDEKFYRAYIDMIGRSSKLRRDANNHRNTHQRLIQAVQRRDRSVRTLVRQLGHNLSPRLLKEGIERGL